MSAWSSANAAVLVKATKPATARATWFFSMIASLSFLHFYDLRNANYKNNFAAAG
jgi:hypothetical protein